MLPSVSVGEQSFSVIPLCIFSCLDLPFCHPHHAFGFISITPLFLLEFWFSFFQLISLVDLIHSLSTMSMKSPPTFCSSRHTCKYGLVLASLRDFGVQTTNLTLSLGALNHITQFHPYSLGLPLKCLGYVALKCILNFFG